MNLHGLVVLPDVENSSFKLSLAVPVTQGLHSDLLKFKGEFIVTGFGRVVHAVEDVAINIRANGELGVMDLEVTDVLQSEEVEVDVTSEGEVCDGEGHFLIKLEEGA